MAEIFKDCPIEMHECNWKVVDISDVGIGIETADIPDELTHVHFNIETPEYWQSNKNSFPPRMLETYKFTKEEWDALKISFSMLEYKRKDSQPKACSSMVDVNTRHTIVITDDRIQEKTREYK
jgi:hypothetical protein